MQNTNRRGAIGELKAAAWLLGQGYEVFRNLCPSGPADLVIWKPGEDCILVDVKAYRPYKTQDGARMYIASTKDYLKARKLGVRYLCYDIDADRFHWLDEAEQDQAILRRERREENRKRFALLPPL